MAIFPRPSSPRDAIADFRAYFTHGNRRDHIIGGTLAILVTIIILIVFFVDSQINTAPRRTIQYVDSWPADRTDAEILAQQKKDQAEADARAKANQEKFKKLEKTLGM
jgi:hypothetical protein